MQFLPYVIAVLQLGAGIVYLYHHEWRIAIIWVPLAVSNFAFAGIR